LSATATLTDPRGPRLIGDIGGTNARFALAVAGRVEQLRVLPTADYPSLVAAARAYLAALPHGIAVERAAFDLAGPVTADHAQLTNGTWAFSIAAARTELGLHELVVLNDFAAAALGIPRLPPGDAVQIGGGAALEHGPVGVIGPGTGLGVAGLVHAGGRWLAVPGEGGHGTMPPATDEESRILDRLRARFGHVSAERVLSGHGLENLYSVLGELHGGVAPPPLGAADITAAALAGADALSARALDLFCDMLGTVAGNLALTLGATGGVFLLGGILPRFADRFAASGFRARFESKGRLSPYLAAIPTYLVTHDNPALLGLAGLA
jgi:glucokinase